MSAKQNGAARSSDAASTSSVKVHAQRDIKYEITVFAVSPLHQGLGLGARVLQAIEWLVRKVPPEMAHLATRRVDLARPANAPLLLDACLTGDQLRTLTKGIDLDKLKEKYKTMVSATGTLTESSVPSVPLYESTKPKLVLMGIRELGTEDYYKRRGYKSIWSGTVPVGMWDCKEECTMVYMEKEL